MIDREGIGASHPGMRPELGQLGDRDGCANTRYPGHHPARLPPIGRSQAPMTEHKLACPQWPSNDSATCPTGPVVVP